MPYVSDVKEAVRLALETLKTVYDPNELHDVLLEEVEHSHDEKYWFITLGFTRPVEVTATTDVIAQAFGAPKFKREYKIFQIEVDTGAVRSMKIRSI